MPVAFLLGPVSHLMPITQLDQQPSKLRDHTQSRRADNEFFEMIEYVASLFNHSRYELGHVNEIL